MMWPYLPCLWPCGQLERLCDASMSDYATCSETRHMSDNATAPRGHKQGTKNHTTLRQSHINTIEHHNRQGSNIQLARMYSTQRDSKTGACPYIDVKSMGYDLACGIGKVNFGAVCRPDSRIYYSKTRTNRS